MVHSNTHYIPAALVTTWVAVPQKRSAAVYENIMANALEFLPSKLTYNIELKMDYFRRHWQIPLCLYKSFGNTMEPICTALFRL